MKDKNIINGVVKSINKVFKGVSVTKKISKRNKRENDREVYMASNYIKEHKKTMNEDSIDMSLLGTAQKVYRQIVEVLREMNFDGYVSESTMSKFRYLSGVFSDVVQSAKNDIKYNRGFCNEEEYKQIEELAEKIKKAGKVVGSRYILDSDKQEKKIDRMEVAEQLSKEENYHRMEDIDIS